jgi:hypothetical protein
LGFDLFGFRMLNALFKLFAFPFNVGKEFHTILRHFELRIYSFVVEQQISQPENGNIRDFIAGQDDRFVGISDGIIDRVTFIVKINSFCRIT